LSRQPHPRVVEAMGAEDASGSSSASESPPMSYDRYVRRRIPPRGRAV
jgi:hypothetical protein